MALLGNVTITDSALASILGLAAHEVPGVVGMSPAGLRESISRILGRSEASEGVVVKPDGKGYQIDVFVVLAYGSRIPTVVENIAQRVKWAGKTMAGIEVTSTRVHVVGVSRAQ